MAEPCNCGCPSEHRDWCPAYEHPLAAEVRRLEEAMRNIGDFAHDHSTGPAVPDSLWLVREMAYDALRAPGVALPLKDKQ